LFWFDGRMSRRTFATRRSLAVFLLFLLFGASVEAIFRMLELGGVSPVLAIGALLLLFMAMIWISAATAIRRLHDRDRSGWLVFILLVPFVSYWIVVETFLLRGTNGSNSYGPSESSSSEGRYAGLILGSAVLVVLSFLAPMLLRSLIVQP